MNKKFWRCFGIFAVLLFAVLVALFFKYKKCNLDYVIKINGYNVMQDEVDLYLSLMKNEMEESANIETEEERAKFWEQNIDGVSTLEIVKEKAYDYLITNKVSAYQAKKMKFKVDESELEEKITELTYLLDERNINNVSDILMKKFAEDIILNNKLYNEIIKDVTFSDEDILKSYNIYNVKQIVLENKSENVANMILNRINSGEDFDKFVVYSIDEETKDNGGRFSFYNGEFCNNIYEQTIMGLKIGEVSNLVETEDGIYIIKLESVVKPEGDVLSEIKLKYGDDVLEEKRSNAYDDKVKEWVCNAEIEYNYK